MTAEATDRFDSWCILELMGHVRMAGRVTEEEHFGSKMGRIDVPGPDDTFTSVFFGGGSVYRMTPTTEAIARSVASHHKPEPVHRWELPKPEEAARVLNGERSDEFDEEPDYFGR